jgi:hypothetical protein
MMERFQEKKREKVNVEEITEEKISESKISLQIKIGRL